MRMSWIKRVKLIGGIIGVRQYRRIGMESGSESVIGGLLKQSEKKPITIIVEGNIGSGKTTYLNFCKTLAKDYVSVVEEPIDKWRNCRGHNLLDLMYKDPVKWSLCFQSYVQLTMLDLHTKPVANRIKMMERSIFSAKYCFVQNLRDQGLMNDAEYTVLTEWFDFIQEAIPLQVDGIVYLRTDPEVVYERISKRGRSEEDSISLSYLRSVHELHEDWLIRGKFGPVPKVWCIAANDDLEEMWPKYFELQDKLNNFPVSTPTRAYAQPS